MTNHRHNPLSPDTLDLIRRAAARHNLRFLIASIVTAAAIGGVLVGAIVLAIQHGPGA